MKPALYEPQVEGFHDFLMFRINNFLTLHVITVDLPSFLRGVAERWEIFLICSWVARHLWLEKITILGGGNTAFAVAARLSHIGNLICLLEHPDFAESVTELSQVKEITLEGVMETGPAPIAMVTIDPKEALDFSDLLLLIVPAYAHRPFAEFVGPYLQSDHKVVIMPGTLGSMEFAAVVSDFGISGLTIAEVDTAPYVCRKTVSDRSNHMGRDYRSWNGGVALR